MRPGKKYRHAQEAINPCINDLSNEPSSTMRVYILVWESQLSRATSHYPENTRLYSSRAAIKRLPLQPPSRCAEAVKRRDRDALAALYCQAIARVLRETASCRQQRLIADVFIFADLLAFSR